MLISVAVSIAHICPGMTNDQGQLSKLTDINNLFFFGLIPAGPLFCELRTLWNQLVFSLQTRPSLKFVRKHNNHHCVLYPSTSDGVRQAVKSTDRRTSVGVVAIRLQSLWCWLSAVINAPHMRFRMSSSSSHSRLNAILSFLCIVL